MKVTAENYEALKGFGLWLVDQRLGEQLARMKPESHPRFGIEQIERLSPAQARKSVGMMIGDLVEETEGLNERQLAAYDEALKNQGLPTLSEVRGQFSRRIRAIMKHDLIRSDDDYYALRNVADALPNGDRERAWAMLDSYMMAGGDQ